MLAALTAVCTATITERGAQSAQQPRHPNVVVVMTDDQDARSVRVMEAVEKQVRDRGTNFSNAFATFPQCCPARATFHSGQYAHNHGVLDNSAPDGGYEAFRDARTLAVGLNRSGYRTGLIGKYLNGYEASHPVPPGWDFWRAAVKDSTAMYGYDLMNERGGVQHYGDRAADYQTDVYADKAVSYVRESHRRGGPFFLAVMPGAPHTGPGKTDPPPLAAPRDEGKFGSAPLPKPPSYNEADVSDKPSHIRSLPRITNEKERYLKRLHRGRLASLLAVDDLVRRVVAMLRRTGELDDTLVVFTSDNGYMLGEHRLDGKFRLYEESISVPLYVRGPGMPSGVQRKQLAGNIDLAPTILDAANADPEAEMDGQSLLTFAADPATGQGRDLLFENFGKTRRGDNGGSRGVRTSRYLYAEHPGGDKELYDLARDPFQLESRHGNPAYSPIQADLADRLRTLEDCKGAECR